MLPSGTSDIYHDTQPCGSRKRHLEGFEASESDSLDEPTAYTQPSTSTPRSMTGSSGPPPNGKKTKGRVKIKMEYIDNKLRRYTTFSKRKTGIMKKAYELSTLTGTQVMLLVASETGHVYTFATRKLQPMITSEAGKALIQTCLNSPDASQPVPQASAASGDQRMSATGFEETELSYHIEDGEKVRQQQLLSNYQLHESQYQSHSQHAQQLLLDSQLQLQSMQSGASQYHHHMSHQSPQQGHSGHHQYSLGGPQ
ncbi:Hypothetical predicted protein [Cloeon dipterum]|uniref:Serum response factor homolog n=1 Tax=Cloeon dipterum TaxID=197152 RepID=A0A8S1DW91_9INSE|nr:Hypothetical predicted protein [Cloeon dipterum]